MENPAASGGLLVMALTASAIVVNATMLQPGDSPRPNPAARSSSGGPAVQVPTPRPRDPIATELSRAALPPLPLAPGAPASRASVAGSAAVIADIQRELNRRGLYDGRIDGIAGSRTRAAVVAYQGAAGISPTGIASAELLAFMRQPAPARSAGTSPIPPVPIPAAVTKPGAAAPLHAPADPAVAEGYRKVQLALNQIGYGPIPVDGRNGSETSDAIRRFELDYGLQVTGVPSEALTRRLIAIGALPAR
jgi:peptidoglycan hydrolase-like protein with peptidoglycan-binding domain